MTQIILQQNTTDDTEAYDVYDLTTDEFRDFDDLRFVETLTGGLPVAWFAGWKRNDSESACWVWDRNQADAIRAEDPSLIVDVIPVNEDEPVNSDYRATYQVG